MKRALVTGGAGFIGSHIVDRLIKNKWEVVVLDNLSTGKKSHIDKHLLNSNFRFFQADLFEKGVLEKAAKGVEVIYHFSANADVKKGIKDTKKDFKQGFFSTQCVLETMRKNNVKKIIFPSSMTVYGRTKGKIAEDYGPCLPISFYAGAKLAAEGIISAYSDAFGIQAYIFRFANVIGPRLTHGVIFDLVNKLLNDPSQLEVLGNGLQTKPYIWIEDLLDGIKFVEEHAKEPVNLFNIGVENAISVKRIVSIIIRKMHISAKIIYGSSPYGWVGDVTKFSLNVNKLKKLGFIPKYTSKEAVEKTVDSILLDLNYGK